MLAPIIDRLAVAGAWSACALALCYVLAVLRYVAPGLIALVANLAAK